MEVTCWSCPGPVIAGQEAAVPCRPYVVCLGDADRAELEIYPGGRPTQKVRRSRLGLTGSLRQARCRARGGRAD